MRSYAESITRTTTIMAAIIAVIIAVAIPAGYFSISYKYIQGNVDAHLEFVARIVEDMVMRNPDTWQFEEVRLQELLERRLDPSVSESFTIRDIHGKTITEIKEPLSRPLLIRRVSIYDAGSKAAVLEGARSIFPLLVDTAEVGVVSILLGCVAFIFFRTVPLGALRKAYSKLEMNESALHRSEEFARGILDSVDEGFLVIDREFQIITANKTYCKWAGVDCREIVGKKCYEISRSGPIPCYSHRESCPPSIAFETGETHVSVHKHEDRNGDTQYFETRAFPMKDESGAVTSVIETFHNITERHLLDAERSKSQKLEAIGILAGGIAHDFNNLLQGVFGYISLAKLNLDKREKVAALLEQAEKGLNMSVKLTAQLLTFSKGGRPVKTKIILDQVIEDCAKFALSGSSSDYRIDPFQGLRPVNADYGQISQVLQNIVLNASDAMPGGGIVRISAGNVDLAAGEQALLPNGGKYVRINIKDTGAGISDEDLPRIFDPYFTTKIKGSGLGLATSYSIVKNHGGAIEVQSEPGKGSLFSVYLPALEADSPEKMISPSPLEAGKFRILLMDDEEMIRTVSVQMIKALGHEVETAVDGDDAIGKFRLAADSGRPYDTVILDLTVRGGMGGAEAVRKILEIDPGVRAIVSSGYSENQVTSDYQAFGFSRCLHKPYNLNSLKDILNVATTK